MATKTQTAKKNTPFKLDYNTFTNPGYTFKGWSTNKTSTVVEYTDGQENVVFTSDKTLYAIWQQGTTIKDYIQGYLSVTEKLSDPANISEQQLLSFGTRDAFITPYSTPEGTSQQFFAVKKSTLGSRIIEVRNAETSKKVALEDHLDRIISGETYVLYYSDPASPTTKTNNYNIFLI